MHFISSRSSTCFAILMACILWWYTTSVFAQNPMRLSPPDGGNKKWAPIQIESRNSLQKMNGSPRNPGMNQNEAWVKRNTGSDLPPRTPPTQAPFISQDKERLNILQWLDSPTNYGTNNFVLKPNKKIEDAKKKKPIKPPRMRRMER